MTLPSPARTTSNPNLVSTSTQQIRAVDSIATGVEVRSISFESSRNVVREPTPEVVEIILQSKRDTWNDRELSDLVDDYFENSIVPLDFCTHLDTSLNLSKSIIKSYLEKFEDERSTKTLEELRNFRGIGDPFTQEFYDMFKLVYSWQISMLEKVQIKNKKLDKKLRKLNSWRKVANVIFVVAFVSVWICSVAAASIRAPTLVTALSAATAVPIGLIGVWLNRIWTRYRWDMRGQRDIIGSMQVANYISIKDLDNITMLNNIFQTEFEVLKSTADYSVRDEEALVISVEEIKKKVDGYIKACHELSDNADKCSQDTRRARTLILQRIINYPNRSNQEIV